MKQDTHRRRMAVYFVMSLAAALAIFVFSSQPAEESEQASGLVVKIIEHMFGSFLNEDLMQFLVRKAAHMLIYFVLGCCVSLLVHETGYDAAKGSRFLTRAACTAGSIVICFLYACSDEWHQTFVPGRSGQLRDVGIDAIGFCMASLLLAVWLNIWEGYKNGTRKTV